MTDALRIRKVGVTEPDVGVLSVGIAEQEDGADASLVLSRSVRPPTEQDIALGQDTYSISNRLGATTYGGATYEFAATTLTIPFTANAARDLGLPLALMLDLHVGRKAIADLAGRAPDDIRREHLRNGRVTIPNTDMATCSVAGRPSRARDFGDPPKSPEGAGNWVKWREPRERQTRDTDTPRRVGEESRPDRIDSDRILLSLAVQLGACTSLECRHPARVAIGCVILAIYLALASITMRRAKGLGRSEFLWASTRSSSPSCPSVMS